MIVLCNNYRYNVNQVIKSKPSKGLVMRVRNDRVVVSSDESARDDSGDDRRKKKKITITARNERKSAPASLGREQEPPSPRIAVPPSSAAPPSLPYNIPHGYQQPLILPVQYIHE